MPENNDAALWKIAAKRARFKRNLFSYLVVNSFLWAIWWFTKGHHYHWNNVPWPVWVMLGWGVGLAFQYFDAYHGSKDTLIEQEYEKLKKQQ